MTLPRITEGSLCARVRADPVRHLGAAQLDLLHPYLFNDRARHHMETTLGLASRDEYFAAHST